MNDLTLLRESLYKSSFDLSFSDLIFYYLVRFYYLWFGSAWISCWVCFWGSLKVSCITAFFSYALKVRFSYCFMIFIWMELKNSINICSHVIKYELPLNFFNLSSTTKLFERLYSCIQNIKFLRTCFLNFWIRIWAGLNQLSQKFLIALALMSLIKIKISALVCRLTCFYQEIAPMMIKLQISSSE